MLFFDGGANALFSKKEKQADIQVQDGSRAAALEAEIKRLKLENAQLKGIQSAMPDPYYVRDMNYNVVFYSEAMEKLTGYTADEAKKMKCYQLFNSDVCIPKKECPTDHCIQVKQFFRDASADIYHKNGALLHSLVSNAGVYDEDGNALGAVEIVKDNTLIHKSMNSINQIVANIETASSNLNTALNKTQNISKQVNVKAHESLSSVKNGVQACTGVSEKAGHSSKYAGNNVRANLETINKSMEFLVEKISNLKEKSEDIIKFVKMIQEISSKTNLLSINASIEAAHAGEVGRGFKVVADGIRELSKNSSESAQSIKTSIHEIGGLIQETINSLNITEKDIESGTNSISELLTSFNDIDESAKVLLNIMATVENAAIATTQLGDEQGTTVIEVEKVGKNLSEIAKQLTEEIIKVIEHSHME